MESMPNLVPSEDAESNHITRLSPPESVLDTPRALNSIQFQDDIHAFDSLASLNKHVNSFNVDSLNFYHADFYNQNFSNFEVAGDILPSKEQLRDDSLSLHPVVEANKVDALCKDIQSTFYSFPEPTLQISEEKLICEASTSGPFDNQPSSTIYKQERTLAQEAPAKPEFNSLEPTNSTLQSHSLVPAPDVTLQNAFQTESTVDSIISPVYALERLRLYAKTSVEVSEVGILPKTSTQSTALDRRNLIQCNFTGRRKALLIGINYFGTSYELKGCINDVHSIKNFLMETYGFPSEGIVMMTDNQINNPERMPTRQNILDAMNWLADGARPNDSLFFHFSGHGSQVPDQDGDEADGYDETICPCDFTMEGMIVDDEMNRILVRPLPAGCRLTAFFDCCHSGTALDLPYIYNSQGELKVFQPAKAVVSALYDLGAKTQKGDLVGALTTLKNGVRMVVNGKTTEINNQRDKGGVADVIMFSSCKDSQTSSDAIRKNLGDSGAMSLALIAALRTNPQGLSYVDLLNRVRQTLQSSDFSQVPQLSSARPMDMSSLFRM